jgi:argininosuccinate synthase
MEHTNLTSMKTATFEAKPGDVKKIVLLYSGGLDTSVLLKWIKDQYKADIIALTVDLGQPVEDLQAIRNKALKMGAKKAYVIDAKDEFADLYIAKAIKANGMYEGGYPLSTAIGRYLISKLAVEVARKEGADAVAHGSTGKGNDQVRFDSSVITLNPKLKIVAPVRDWNMTRDEEIKYAQENGIPIPVSVNNPYSTDENMWGKSTECGVLEDPATEPPKEAYNFCVAAEDAPNIPTYVELEFERGVPTKLNGKKMKLSALILTLTEVARKNGVGFLDQMEDRIVGLKSRETYECPAAVVIIEAHKDLEKFVSTIHENTFKPMIDAKWSYMAYAGLWYDPLMDELNAYCDKANEKVTGSVRMKLYKGKATVVGRKSPYAIYSKQLASYNIGHTFNQKASPGFIELWSLQSKIAYQVKPKK